MGEASVRIRALCDITKAVFSETLSNEWNRQRKQTPFTGGVFTGVQRFRIQGDCKASWAKERRVVDIQSFRCLEDEDGSQSPRRKQRLPRVPPAFFTLR